MPRHATEPDSHIDPVPQRGHRLRALFSALCTTLVFCPQCCLVLHASCITSWRRRFATKRIHRRAVPRQQRRV